VNESYTPAQLDTSFQAGVRVCGHRVLVLPDEAERETKGGILLPDQTTDREALAQIHGTLICIGPSAWADQKTGPWAKPGDRVIFGKYAGLYYDGRDGRKYRIVNDLDIVAVIDKEH
jgi:chaperonin GroES